MNTLIYIQLLAIIGLFIFILLSIYSYIKNKEQISIVILMMLFFTLLWGLGLIAFGYYTETDKIIDVVNLIFIFSSFIPPLMLLFSIQLTHFTTSKIAKYAIFIPAITISFACIFTNGMVRGYVPETQTIVYGPLYPIFAINLFAFVAISLYILFNASRKKGIIGLQSKYLFISYGLTAFFGLAINVILPNLINSSKYSGLGFIGTLFAIIGMFYVTRRYRFLDIKYFLAQSLFTIISAMFVFSVFYIVAFILIQLFGTLFALPAYFLAGMIAMLFVLSYPRVRHTLQYVIDQELLKAEYNREEIYEAINTAVGQELDISNLQNKVLNGLIENGITTGGYFWVFADEERSFKESIAKKHLNSQGKLNLLLTPILIKYLTRSKQVIVREEIQTLINETSSDSDGILNEALKFLEETDTNILLPIFGKKKLIALIGLKRKLSESPFTLQDIDLFDSISTPISVAIERSILFEESKNFAKTLQYRVDEATAELKEAYEELQRIDAEKDDFISIAGHELRTPAAIIKMSLWMLKNYKEIKSDKAVEKLENALTANERLIRLINDLLTTSRIDRSKFKLEPVKFDIVELIKNTVKDNEFLAKDKGLRLNFKDPNTSVTVEADKDKIIEVITNLISNSVKYTDKGSVNLEFSHFKDHVSLCITDTGIGIKKEDQRKLFKKFSRLDHSFSTTAKIRGTGLGLYITKSILEQHKGSIK
ncbi:MAG: ATP-binding protein, partial [Candidatus Pacearchaeota archaeon]